jgi:hypothetical protein
MHQQCDSGDILWYIKGGWRCVKCGATGETGCAQHNSTLDYLLSFFTKFASYIGNIELASLTPVVLLELFFGFLGKLLAEAAIA